jgi:KRAB box
VEYEFSSEEWEQLAPSQRIFRCRVMAEEARKLSIRASPELKQLYLDLSDKWSALANEFEKKIR